MALKRLPFRDPRTVARDIPGVLDILFPRLSGGLVASLNRKMFSFANVTAISDERVEASQLQKAMLFELAIARAEQILDGIEAPNWDICLIVATDRQKRYFDAKVPDHLDQNDRDIADQAAHNLVEMLRSVKEQYPDQNLEKNPSIPGLGWISSGVGDFALGHLLIEVKHTDRNFVAGDFRQVLMYWTLKYASSIEKNNEVWSDCLLLNPRRNAALVVNFNYLLRSASSSASHVEIYELLRSIAGQEFDRR